MRTAWWRPGEPCRTSRMSVSSAGAAERDVRPGVWGLSGSLQPSLALVELTCSDPRASEHYQRGCDHRFGAPAVPLGEGERLAAAPLGCGERVEDERCEPELRQAADFQVGAADLPGEVSALPEAAFGVRRVWQPERPRLGGPQTHQRHRAQVAAERDVLVGLPGYRGGEEPGLLDDAGQVTASPGQRQLQRRDRHPEAALRAGAARVLLRAAFAATPAAGDPRIGGGSGTRCARG